MIFCYNPSMLKDILLVVVEPTNGEKVTWKRSGDVAQIRSQETNRLLGWNIFELSRYITVPENKGQVYFSNEELAQLNQVIELAGFQDQLAADEDPKIVVGLVEECEPHPDSDHLSITKTRVDNGTVLQIVCGAPNIKAGLRVVVAKIGAFMPDGMIIWPGNLRGVESAGMICSARELAIPNAPMKKGIMELPATYEVGSEFKPE